jgi:hypothetical protein
MAQLRTAETSFSYFILSKQASDMFSCRFFLYLLALLAATSTHAIRLPFLKKKYTPLLFFKVPPGLIPECDAMEKCVRDVELELGVRVERLDILRDPSAEAVLALLTQKTPPFLYHRESCQVVHVTPSSGDSSKADMPIAIDKQRVRAWAKGRLLQARREASGKKSATPVVVSQEDNSISQDDLLEDMALTPEQLKGKQLIRERTEAKSKDAKK